MIRPILKNIAENISFSSLASNWQDFDLEEFSKNKKLYDFQQEALKNALKTLWFYYDKAIDYKDGEDLKINDLRKEKLFKEYLDWGLEQTEVAYKYREEQKHKFIFDYYDVENNEISFKHFVNRMSFWMATGSGKTLVIIKLIEILKKLIENKEIPDFDILFLTHRDDLIEQFLKHLEEFNQNSQSKIRTASLKDYEKIKRDKVLFKENIVFYYRADNLSDKEKEKLIDFRNYFNDGKWYIILDEAHKGDKEESKRQHIFSILSKNGFLFNFSATFDDIRDLITCVYEFNLASFIENGYGKNIYISKYEADAFRNKEDFDNLTKQKIILKTLILLTYIKKQLEKIRNYQSNLYHKPLLLALVNSVNQELADLKLFFDEIRKIAKGEFNKELVEEAKNELIEELSKEKEFVFPKDEKYELDIDCLKEINYDDILKYVFNSDSSSDIEISYNPSNRAEVALKLTSSSEHFALIKTGDMPKWLKESLDKFNVNHQFENEIFFKKLNEEESTINILLGSRAFYEGWDSNRPNIIMFINIGVQKDAKKFVMQSVGRGVRIEPVKGKRKRAKYLGEEFPIKELYEFKDSLIAIESLSIFATNKSAIETILKEIQGFKESTGEKRTLSLFKNVEKIKNEILLIPKYKESSTKRRFELENKSRYLINENDLNLVKDFVRFVDDRILLINFNSSPKLVKFFKETLKEENINNFYKTTTHITIREPFRLISRIFDFWCKNIEEFEKIKELEDEIKHFEKIEVELKELKESDFQGLRDLIISVKENKKSLSFGIDLKYIPDHYYIPLIVTKKEKDTYIKHVIKTKSEADFIEKLEKYSEEKNNKFNKFDWWMFSKLDESLDDVYIPYYNYDTGKIAHFIPDFIFWLRKGNNYYIVFIDPKGTTYRDFEAKILGYKEIFEENNKAKQFSYQKDGNKFNCYVYCFLYTQDVDKVKTSGYKDYWFENIDRVLTKFLQ